MNAYNDMAQVRAVEMVVNNSSPTSLKDMENVYDLKHTDVVDAVENFSENGAGHHHGVESGSHQVNTPHCNRVSELSKEASNMMRTD